MACASWPRYLDLVRDRGGAAVWCVPEGGEAPLAADIAAPAGRRAASAGVTRRRASRLPPADGRAASSAPTSRAAAGIVRRDAVDPVELPRLARVARTSGSSSPSRVFYYLSKLVRVAPFHTPAQYFAFAVVGIVIFGIVRSVALDPERCPAGARCGHVRASRALAVRRHCRHRLAADLPGSLLARSRGVRAGSSPSSSSACTSTGRQLRSPCRSALAGAFAFAPFALVFAAITLAFKQAPGQNAALAVISLASGMYFPVALLPWWLHWISEVQPFTPTVDSAAPRPDRLPDDRSRRPVALAKIAGFIVIGIPLGVAPRLARGLVRDASAAPLIEY